MGTPPPTGLPQKQHGEPQGPPGPAQGPQAEPHEDPQDHRVHMVMSENEDPQVRDLRIFCYRLFIYEVHITTNSYSNSYSLFCFTNVQFFIFPFTNNDLRFFSLDFYFYVIS